MAGRRRSTRSHVIELVVVAVVVVGIWLFLANGGPSAAGDVIGPMFTAP